MNQSSTSSDNSQRHIQKDIRAIKIATDVGNPFWGIAYGTPNAILATPETQSRTTFYLHDDGTIWAYDDNATLQPCVFYSNFALVLRATGDGTTPATFDFPANGKGTITVNDGSNTALRLFTGGLVIKSDNPTQWRVFTA